MCKFFFTEYFTGVQASIPLVDSEFVVSNIIKLENITQIVSLIHFLTPSALQHKMSPAGRGSFNLEMRRIVESQTYFFI